MSTETKDLERLERDYQERKAQIRSDPELSWEKKQLAIKRLSEEHHARRRALEETA